MKEFKNITVSIPEEYFELAIATLMDFSVLGIREDFDTLIITFDNDIVNEELINNLLEALQHIYPETKISSQELISPKNWNEEWEKNVPLIKISDRIDILPEWKKSESSAEIPIIINPKMSFGTGQHETTRLISRLMEKYCKPNQNWIDVGTGTGVLAILAIKLGANSVFAFDNNEWAIENARENVILNKVEEFIEIVEADIEEIELPSADGISANLYANLVIYGFEKFHKSLIEKNGILLVSGILKYQEEEILIEAKRNRFELLEIIYEEEWLSAAFKAI